MSFGRGQAEQQCKLGAHLTTSLHNLSLPILGSWFPLGPVAGPYKPTVDLFEGQQPHGVILYPPIL